MSTGPMLGRCNVIAGVCGFQLGRKQGTRRRRGSSRRARMDDRDFATALQRRGGRRYSMCRYSGIALAPLIAGVVAVIAVGAAQAATRPDLTGTWELDAARSDDPQLAQKKHESSGGGTGVAKRVTDG